MLKIASYSLRGQIVRVKLKCTCGTGRVFEVQEEGETVYFCEKCRERKMLDELKREASTYWRGRDWVVECEADHRTQPRIHVAYPIELTVKENSHSPSYCVLHGQYVVLSESGTLIVVEDFRESYFQDITTTYRYVEAVLSDTVEGFPPVVTGNIVGVNFRHDELPRCRIGVGFEDLSDEANAAIRKHIEDHVSRNKKKKKKKS